MTPSAMRKAAALEWSAMTRMAMSVASELPYAFPESLERRAMMFSNMSVSKLLSFPWQTAAILSRPMPVSMHGSGSGLILPVSSLKNCIKTRFHISRKRSQSHPTLQSWRLQPTSSPWSMSISEHGPHGPVSPMAQKLSSSSRRTTLSGEMPVSLGHSSAASSSSRKTVTHSFSLGRPSLSTKNSQANSMASFLK